MKIYTRTGDKGSTSLVGGKRVSKADPRLDAYGTVDELNAWLGLLASDARTDGSTVTFLRKIQSRLFNVGAYLATDNTDNPTLEPAGLTEDDITLIENEIDRLNSLLCPQTSFILPGGCTASARANIACTVCRRAERCIVTLALHATVSPSVISYINRLSDYLFTLSRYFNHITSTPEIPWVP